VLRRHLRQLASDSVVYGLSGIVARFLSVWLVPIYTRLLTPQDYGTLSLVNATLAVITSFSALALDNSAYRWYWDTDDVDDRRRTIGSWLWCEIAVAGVAGLLLWVLSDRVGVWTTQTAASGVHYRTLAWYLPPFVLYVVAINWCRLQHRPWTAMWLTLAVSLTQIGLGLVLVVWFRRGVNGVFQAQVGSQVVGAAVALVLMRGWLSPRWLSWPRLREMLRYALPLIPAAVAVWVVNSADRYFVQRYVSTTEVGLYSIGGAIAALVALVTGAFQQAWSPFALSIHREANAQRTYAMVLLGYSALTAVGVAALGLFSPYAIHLLATSRYLRASEGVGLLAFSYVLIGMSSIVSIGLSIAKTSHHSAVAITLAAVATIGLNALFVPRYGMIGSAVATVIGQSIGPAYSMYRAHKLYPVNWPVREVVALFVLSLALVAAGVKVLPSVGWAGFGARVAAMLTFVPLAWVLAAPHMDRIGPMLAGLRRRPAAAGSDG
jgi:O-antigen/teichoic acid export membrane protein